MLWNVVLSAFRDQRGNLFVWTPVPLALGIGIYFSLPFEVPLVVGAVLWGVFSAGIALPYVALRGRQDSLGGVLPLILIAVWLVGCGFFLSQIRTSVVDTSILHKKNNITEVIGTIHSIEDQEEYEGQRFVLDDLEIENLDPLQTPKSIRLGLRGDAKAQLEIGDRIRVIAQLTPPSPPLIPGGFDFRRYLYFQGIGAVGFIFRPPEILEKGDKSVFDVGRHRKFVAERIRQSLPEQQAAVFTALVVGQRMAISEKNTEALRAAGLAHILAISGLHVGLMAGTIFFVLRLILAAVPRIALYYPIKKIAAVVGLAGAVGYMLLAGATIPTQRAVLMYGLVFFAVLIDRSPLSMRLVAFAALVVLAIAPESLLSVSFQMSFAAVVGLIAFYEWTRTFWEGQLRRGGVIRKVLLYFIGVCITSVIASLATAPFSLYHFQQFAVLGIVANMVAVPLMAFVIMPFALLSLLLMPVGLDALPMVPAGWAIEWILQAAHWVASLPGAVVTVSQWPFCAFLCFVIGGVFVCFWRGAGKVAAAPVFFVGCVLVLQSIPPDILVSSRNKLIALSLQEGGGFFASSRRNDRFVLESWARLYGIEKGDVKIFPAHGGVDQTQGLPGYCGEEGCRFEVKGAKISFVRDPYILVTECGWADIVLSEEPVSRTCRAPFVIDRFDTSKRGAHAVYIGAHQDAAPQIRVETVRDYIGARPWH